MKETEPLVVVFFKYLLCLISSSFLLAIFYLSGFSNFGFVWFVFYFICAFIIYLIVAIPIQIILNRYPKKFYILHFIVYLLFACIPTFILVKSFNTPDINPFYTLDFYKTAFCSALIFWICDSVFLQKGRVKFF